MNKQYIFYVVIFCLAFGGSWAYDDYQERAQERAHEAKWAEFNAEVEALGKHIEAEKEKLQ